MHKEKQLVSISDEIYGDIIRNQLKAYSFIIKHPRRQPWHGSIISPRYTKSNKNMKEESSRQICNKSFNIQMKVWGFVTERKENERLPLLLWIAKQRLDGGAMDPWRGPSEAEKGFTFLLRLLSGFSITSLLVKFPFSSLTFDCSCFPVPPFFPHFLSPSGSPLSGFYFSDFNLPFSFFLAFPVFLFLSFFHSAVNSKNLSISILSAALLLAFLYPVEPP